jgi:hypothetical protein
MSQPASFLEGLERIISSLSLVVGSVFVGFGNWTLGLMMLLIGGVLSPKIQAPAWLKILTAAVVAFIS